MLTATQVTARGNTVAVLGPEPHPSLPRRIVRTVLPAPARAALRRALRALRTARRRVRRRLRRALGLRAPARRPPAGGVPVKAQGHRPPTPTRRPGVSVKGGRHLHPEQWTRVPVVLVVTFGLDAARLADTVASVAWQQTLQQSFAPVFVTDRTDPTAFRAHDYLYEYVMPLEDWSTFHDPELWPAFVTERLAELCALYRPQSVVSVGVDGPLGGIAFGLSTYAPPVAASDRVTSAGASPATETL